MTKTKDELAELRKEYETINNKLKELSEDELKMVTGGKIMSVSTIENIYIPLPSDQKLKK